MKVVYSPYKEFTLSVFVIAYLREHYQIDKNGAYELPRNDERLVLATEKDLSRPIYNLTLVQAHSLLRSDTNLIRLLETVANVAPDSLNATSAYRLLRSDQKLFEFIKNRFKNTKEITNLAVMDIGDLPFIVSKTARNEIVVTGTPATDIKLLQNQISALGLPYPVTLNSADIDRPFIYLRDFGVFYLAPFTDSDRLFATILMLLQLNMRGSQLLGCMDRKPFGVDLSVKDYFLKTLPGSFINSGNGGPIRALKGSLNIDELNFIKDKFIEELNI
ncbi:TPA: hypothetical protein MW242_003312 [Acinetobacter baumannii]|nr:hypothetical protein [Acinetobacter baumannii]